MAKPFDPYHIWLGIPSEEQPPNHYRLLGIMPFESNSDAIQNAADRQMTHLRTFQTGERAEFSQRLLNEVAAAKVCLLNPSKKAAYDAQLKARLQGISPLAPAPASPAVEALDPALEALLEEKSDYRRNCTLTRHRTHDRLRGRWPFSPQRFSQFSWSWA